MLSIFFTIQTASEIFLKSRGLNKGEGGILLPWSAKKKRPPEII